MWSGTNEFVFTWFNIVKVLHVCMSCSYRRALQCNANLWNPSMGKSLHGQPWRRYALSDAFQFIFRFDASEVIRWESLCLQNCLAYRCQKCIKQCPVQLLFCDVSLIDRWFVCLSSVAVFKLIFTFMSSCPIRIVKANFGSAVMFVCFYHLMLTVGDINRPSDCL